MYKHDDDDDDGGGGVFCVLRLLCEQEVYSVPHKRYLNFSRRQLQVMWSCGTSRCSLA